MNLNMLLTVKVSYMTTVKLLWVISILRYINMPPVKFCCSFMTGFQKKEIMAAFPRVQVYRVVRKTIDVVMKKVTFSFGII